MCYEAGEANKFDEEAINVGIAGIQSVQIELGTRIKEVQKIGKLIDPFGNDYSIYLKSPIVMASYLV